MSHPWLWALGAWIAVPAAFVAFPKTVTSVFVDLGLAERGPWAGLEVLVLGGAGWLAVGTAALIVWLVVRFG